MSKIRVYTIIAVITSFLMTSCSLEKQKTYSDEVVSDINLTVEKQNNYIQKIGWKTFYVRYYFNEGEYYTGKQTYYYKDSEKKHPFRALTFQDGLLVKEVAFNQNGEKMGSRKYFYQKDKIVKVVDCYLNDHKKSLFIHSLFMGKPGSIKKWHKNGQLKFSVKLNEKNNYSGVMTLRDKEGNIIKQKEY